jgi:hypothetical protein
MRIYAHALPLDDEDVADTLADLYGLTTSILVGRRATQPERPVDHILPLCGQAQSAKTGVPPDDLHRWSPIVLMWMPDHDLARVSSRM